MTIAELAKNAGVGTTTVMRLVSLLGLKGFANLKKELFKITMIKTTTSYGSLKQNITDSHGKILGDTLQSVAADGIKTLENVCTPSNIQQFEKIIDMIVKAKKLFTFGARSSRPLSLYTNYALSSFSPHIFALSQDSDYVFDRLILRATSQDLVLLFSIWPCTKKTIEVAEFCHKQGIPIALITNTGINPIVKIASAVIDTNSVNHPSGDTVLMAVVEAIVQEVGRRKAPDSTKRIEKVEKILADNDIVLREY